MAHIIKHNVHSIMKHLMTAMSVCNKPLSCFPLTMMPGKYFTVKSNCKTPSVETFPLSFIFLSPLVILDRSCNSRQKPPKNRQNRPREMRRVFHLVHGQHPESQASRSCFKYTHADSLTDSTKEESMVAGLHRLPCWSGWLTLKFRWSGYQSSSVHTQQTAWLTDDRMIWSSWLGAFYMLLLLVSSCPSCPWFSSSSSSCYLILS